MTWTAATRGDYVRSSGMYASDVTDREWPLIAPHLPAARPGGRPRSACLRRVVNAVFHLLQTGCQWRMLPRDFPPRSTVYGYFRGWTASDVWAHVHDVLCRQTRGLEGREESPSAAIIDSRSVKTGADARGMVGFDAPLGECMHSPVGNGKARQRSRTPPGHGHARPDASRRGPFRRNAGSRRRRVGPRSHHQTLPVHREVLRRRRLPRSARRQNRAAPGGDHQALRCRFPDAGFVVRPKRRVIERTFAWTCINRRLAKDFERFSATAQALFQIAMIKLMSRRIARLGLLSQMG